ncbi:MerR family transcriptional regulator [Gordonibacter sp. 28C]|uniref:MerR family transcriptional regulator n=1 Tax=Gordonibacter sp. 28C TaxID=2078569 RepID=UPI000DF75E7C|nr:MerR family transcriptional regulator [Gordonibacter sp. 28C]RDB64304.1 MerR family transcriptional regulator [Gordonibacter sp. 28C]
MNIGEAAKAAGVTPRALRYYESRGLLAPKRTEAGYRVYDEEDLARIRRIRQLLAAGLSTESICGIAPCLKDGIDGAVPLCPKAVASLKREQRRIAEAVDSLQEAYTALDVILEATEAACEDSEPPHALVRARPVV